MSGLLVEVAIYGLAAAFAAPVAAVVSSLILGVSRRPVASAWAFVAGATIFDVAYCAFLLSSGLLDVSSDASAWIDVGLGALFVLMGVIALFSTESPEKDAARRARAQQIASSSLTKLFVAGLAVQLINLDAVAVFTGALKEIASDELSTAGTVFATAFGLAIMLSVYYTPPLLYSLVPARASGWLSSMSQWILGNSRRLEIVVGLAFGAFFLAKGLPTVV